VVGFPWGVHCPCLRWVWLILRRFIIIFVFLEVLDCGLGFMLCFISRNLVFWFNQWSIVCVLYCTVFVWGLRILYFLRVWRLNRFRILFWDFLVSKLIKHSCFNFFNFCLDLWCCWSYYYYLYLNLILSISCQSWLVGIIDII